jgi:tetratricopeptide (TPR) repeat protein
VERSKRGIALDVHSAQFHRELGLAYNKMMQFEKAVDALREAVRLDPKDDEAWNNLGGALRRLGMRKSPQGHDSSTSPHMTSIDALMGSRPNASH